MNPKCYANDVYLLMADMSVKSVVNLQVGDLVMCDDSVARPILSIEKTVEAGYQVKPIKGESYTVGKDHTLVLRSSGHRICTWRKTDNCFVVFWFNKDHEVVSKSYNIKSYGNDKSLTEEAARNHYSTVEEDKGETIYDRVEDYVTKCRVWRKNYYLYSVPVTFGWQDIYIDPYILGYWLGDGHSDGPQITTENPEVVKYFDEYAKSIGYKLVKKENTGVNIKNNSHTYRINNPDHKSGKSDNKFLNTLRHYDLIKNKHIPLAYKYTDRSVQLAVLAGLIDSDGYLNDTHYDICLVNETLRDDIVDMCLSMGYAVTTQTCQKTCTNSSRGRVTGTYYRMYISGNDFSDLPLLLDYKKANPKIRGVDSEIRSLKVNKLDKDVDIYKIQVDGNCMLRDFSV